MKRKVTEDSGVYRETYLCPECGSERLAFSSATVQTVGYEQPPLSVDIDATIEISSFCQIFSHEPRFVIRLDCLECGADIVLSGAASEYPSKHFGG